MASMKRLMFFAPTINVDCLLFSSLFIYLFIDYLFIQLFICLFIYLSFVYLFAFAVFFFLIVFFFLFIYSILIDTDDQTQPTFTQYWWADSTEIFLPAFIRITTFQSHNRACWLNYNKKKFFGFSVTSHHQGLEAGLEDDIFHPHSVLGCRSFRYKVVSIQVYSV